MTQSMVSGSGASFRIQSGCCGDGSAFNFFSFGPGFQKPGLPEAWRKVDGRGTPHGPSGGTFGIIFSKPGCHRCKCQWEGGRD